MSSHYNWWTFSYFLKTHFADGSLTASLKDLKVEKGLDVYIQRNNDELKKWK